jgi:hypothetical protein
MDTNQQIQLLKAQLKILLELSDRAEEEGSWIDAWIDLKTELLQKLKKLEKGGNHEHTAQ